MPNFENFFGRETSLVEARQFRASFAIGLVREVAQPFVLSEVTVGDVAGFFVPGVDVQIPQDRAAITNGNYRFAAWVKSYAQHAATLASP